MQKNGSLDQPEIDFTFEEKTSFILLENEFIGDVAEVGQNRFLASVLPADLLVIQDFEVESRIEDIATGNMCK